MSGITSAIGHTLHVVVVGEGMASWWDAVGLECHVLQSSLLQDENHIVMADGGILDRRGARSAGSDTSWKEVVVQPDIIHSDIYLEKCNRWKWRKVL